MPKPAEPLAINFFATGLYTHRSQLFAPYRAVGVNVVTYHDAAIDGQDMELTTTFQWSRRAGFARYCSVAFGASEIPLQFYSARQPGGAVVNFADTNQNFSTFTPTSINPLFAKSTTAQGFIQQVGQTTYYANGVDLKKWNGASVNGVSGTGTAAPASAPAVTFVSPCFAWQPGETVPSTLAGGFPVTVLLDPNENFQLAFVNVTGSTTPNWNTRLGGQTQDGSGFWINAGPYATWQPGTAYGLNGGISPFVIVDSNGNLQIAASTFGTSGTTAPSWATHIGGSTHDGSNLIWYCGGNAASGASVSNTGVPSIQSGYLWAYAFRTASGHLSTGSPITPSSGPGLGSPFGATITGYGSIDPACTAVEIYRTADGGGILYFAGSVANPAGTAYAVTNIFATGIGGTSYVTLTLSSVTGLAMGDVVSVFLAPPFTAYGPSAATIASVGPGNVIHYTLPFQINITSQPCTGTVGFGGGWTFTDNVPDANLVTSLICPLAHLNDPPPGAAGSTVSTGGTIMAYWQGRVWMAVGNKLYFDAGPDCINGVPEESWPPANLLQYPGPITALSPTSQGLLVWGADYLSMALGGPQTLSFFPYDLMRNFGVSSPNCVSQDGDTIYAYTTQGQVFLLNDNGKADSGSYIVDQLGAGTYSGVVCPGFGAASSYLTIHRQGKTGSVFLGDGSVSLFRLNTNIGAWSTRLVPVGGGGALNSIETSVGTHTLLLGRPTGGGYILGQTAGVWRDDGQNYPNAFVTIGNIPISPPGGRLEPLFHVRGYFDAVGTLGPNGGPTQPTVAILPNEVSGLSGVGFLTMNQPVSEYTTANFASTTLLSLRWDADSIPSVSSSLLVHHLQVRISFPPENAPNAIKALSLSFERD